jgi:ATP-binding cassette subfamily F protein 3
MNILRLDHIYFSHPAGLVLEDLNWAVQNGEKVGLVGPNGAGKSTILKLLCGILSPDSGLVVKAKGVSLGYLPQEVTFAPHQTVLSEALTASSQIAGLDAALKQIEESLADPATYNDETALTRALERQAALLSQYEEAGGLSYENTVKATLRRLGFSDDDFGLPTNVLSGGQKKMLVLAKLAVNQPAVLLLDEPDNHLDLAGKNHLEHFIRGYPGAVIIVSHDRYLLDEVVDGIVELAGGRFDFYPGGNYSAYVTEKELRRLRQAQMYAAQQKEIARLEAAIARFELWASLVIDERHIKQARNKRRQIEQMDKVDRPLETKNMRLQLDGWRGSDKVLELKEVYKAFADQIILAGVNLTLWHGQRVGLVGPNGAGKSVLFRCITGQERVSEGVIKIGPSVKVGRYAQEHQNLDYDKTLIETVRDLKAMYEEQAVAFLGQFLFPYQATTQRVGSLSGGERSRLQMALLMLQEPNFLLLDEPTNNLDIQSAEVLETALDHFNGTLFVISHDRYFLDKVVDQIVELDPAEATLREYSGGYTDYLAAKKGAPL